MAVYFYLTLIILSPLLIAVGFGVRYRFLLTALIVGVALRIAVFYLNYYGIFSVPGAGFDAARFISVARDYSLVDWQELFSLFNYRSGFSWSILGAIQFKVFGYHEMIMGANNLIFGAFNISIASIVVYKLFGVRPAVIAAFIVAAYPFAIFNSVIALREEISIFFFMVGLLWLVKWSLGESAFGVFISIAFFVIASFVHPGWVGAVVGLFFYFIVVTFRLLRVSAKGGGVKRKEFINAFSAIVLLFFGIVAVAVSGGISLGKGIELSDEQGLGDIVESRFQVDPRGGSAYPAAITQGNPFTQPWLIPARIIYFNYAPFPWDIRSASHLIGFIPSFLYFFLTWRIIKGWDDIKRRDELLVLFFIFLALNFIFALGVSNIGTAIRHKTKFFMLFVILAAASFHTLKVKLRRQ